MLKRAVKTTLLGVTSLATLVWIYTDWRIRVKETVDPATEFGLGKHIQVDTVNIHYEEIGSGPVVVLIHGFGGSTYSWRLNLRAISEQGYRVIALDLPGFGYSSRTSTPMYSSKSLAHLLNLFIDALVGPARHEGVVLIGHSWGAAVCIRFAEDYPECLQGLILAAPTLGFRRFWQSFSWTFDVPILGRAIARALYFLLLGNDRAAGRFVRSAYGPAGWQVTPQMREALLRPLRVIGSADSALGFARSTEDGLTGSRLHLVQVRVDLVAGTLDSAVPLSQVRELGYRLPNAGLHVLAANHLVQESMADEFNGLVASFLGDVLPSTETLGSVAAVE